MMKVHAFLAGVLFSASVVAQGDLDGSFDTQTPREGGPAPSGIGEHAAAPQQDEQDPSGPGQLDQPHDAAIELPQKAPADRGAPRSAPRNRLVEEIVVTAQKREQNLQEVPISVQAFSDEKLEAQGIANVADLPRISPGVVITPNVSYLTSFIRGVGTNAFLLADPSVVIYVNDIYYPFASGASQDFGKVERIEVLKGPQGTLFGRNALGGTINIIMQSPSLEKVETSLSTEYGTYDQPKVKGRISVPLSDHLAASATGFYRNSKYHVDARSDISQMNPEGNKLDRVEGVGGRGTLRWAPSDWFEAEFTGSYSEENGPSSTVGANTDPSLTGQLLGVRPQDPYAPRSDAPIGDRFRNRTYDLRFKTYLPFMDIKLLASDQSIDNFASKDTDGSEQAISISRATSVASVNTAELQFLSNDQSWGSDWLESIAGVYYYDARTGLDPAGFVTGGLELDNGTIGTLHVPEALLSRISQVLSHLPLPTGFVGLVGVLDTTSTACFAQTTIKFGDPFSITLGARYQSEKRILIDSSAYLANSDGSRITTQSYSGKHDSDYRDTTNSFDPKISLQYRPSFDWLGEAPLLYASWQTATKSSTFNALNVTDAPEYVKPEHLEAFEIGLKTQLFDESVTLNAAAFHYRLKNQQVQFVSLLTGGAVQLENAAAGTIRGVELDTLVVVLPSVIDDLALTLSGAYLDGTYDSYPDGRGFDGETGLSSQNNDYTGKRIVYTPEFTAKAGLSKGFRVLEGNLELGAYYYYNDGFSYLPQGTRNASEPAYGVLDAQVSYLFEPWDLRVTVFGRNILNERYNLARYPTDFGTVDSAAPLSNYGLRLNWEF